MPKIPSNLAHTRKLLQTTQLMIELVFLSNSMLLAAAVMTFGLLMMQNFKSKGEILKYD
ncbi:uncharacterized protein DS421_4g123010 [Arachis hypogaea]|nr:uncharacterized protein DS421_4g123010 [Arachis hypogaea]